MSLIEDFGESEYSTNNFKKEIEHLQTYNNDNGSSLNSSINDGNK
jgi:hypothetical protein